MLRLLANQEHTYDEVWIVCTEASRVAAQPLMEAAQAHATKVLQKLVEVEDPSDHAQLFEAMGPIVKQVEEAKGASVDVLLSAGTPQAQTIWVILVEAKLLKARMLQVIPPRFVPVPHPRPIRAVDLNIKGFPEIRALRQEVRRLRAQRFAIDGESAPMRTLKRRIERVAPTELPVLVLGETGTGKELVARAIHSLSDRADGPFVAESCGAIAESVLASELFGHEEGAFTGAKRERKGLFELAHQGTLFLDEVAELPLKMQVHLLRVLQEGTLRRVGGESQRAVDVRVIAATHRDLLAMVEEGSFREDLYYRLYGATLQLPPLRAREGDLELLLSRFLKGAGGRLTLSKEALEALRSYRWPGNVRELKAEVQRWSVFCDEVVELQDLSPAILSKPQPASSAGSLAEAVEQAERQVIEQALDRCSGNLSQTARALQIDRNTLKRKLARWGRR